ncbi:LTA synthase family protein [Taibaiella chishuiensis]|uniref:Phosphoglycerol transferase MdoB-like AlkP superfamily enzyme n=1 Tax=Taibaiella chishuiensis TaxID=1434707 RepID=A0A2P8DBD6_9BACT|nr:sulfatase-like hydrolase/transferase [Taibaiella chishuiensis]PSK94524.1 phosphoglycerol transferase MdoB-like AlkP superfamily enzyme [Taibaiella chishuiensis]
MRKRSVPAQIQWLFQIGMLLLLIMTALRVAFLFVFPAPSGARPVPYAQSLFLGLRYDARMVAVACLLLFATGLIPALQPFRKPKGKKVALALWFIVFLTFLLFYCVDFANYAYLTERLNGGLLNYMADARTSMQMIWQTYPVLRIVLIIIASMFLMMWVVKKLYARIAARQAVLTGPLRIVYPVGFFLLLAFLIFGRIGQYPLRWSDAFTLGNDYASNVALNPFQSFFSSLKFRNATYNIAKVKKAYPEMAYYLGVNRPDSNTLNYTRAIQPATPAAKAPNVVVVICESFSAYKSSMEDNPLNTTPFFASLCKDGVYFSRCFTPSYGTARGVWATITGTPDVGLTKTSSRNPNAVNQHTVMNDFKGYEKHYFIGGSLSWANIRGLLTNNIKDLRLHEQDDYDAEKIDVWGISDKNLFLEANKALSKQTKPFIAVIQTADNHRPYTIPEEDKKTFKLQQVSKDSLKRYGFESLDEYNAFRYTDFCYQQFIEAARKEAYFSNTIFIFVGDHGIGGDAGGMLPLVWTQDLTAMHVPLLFYAPGLIAPARYGMNVSQVDVLPTAAGLAGIPYTNTTLGRDILNPAFLNNPALHASFIYNPDKQRIGVVKDSVFYSYGIEQRVGEQAASMLNNDKLNLTPAQRDYYYNLTEAFYQTSRYMLLNNKAK